MHTPTRTIMYCALSCITLLTGCSGPMYLIGAKISPRTVRTAHYRIETTPDHVRIYRENNGTLQPLGRTPFTDQCDLIVPKSASTARVGYAIGAATDAGYLALTHDQLGTRNTDGAIAFRTFITTVAVASITTGLLIAVLQPDIMPDNATDSHTFYFQTDDGRWYSKTITVRDIVAQRTSFNLNTMTAIPPSSPDHPHNTSP